MRPMSDLPADPHRVVRSTPCALQALHQFTKYETMEVSTYMEQNQQTDQIQKHGSESSTALGKLLAELRSAKGLTSYELARRTGIHRSTLTRIEEGTTTTPDVETLNSLAQALDADPEDLYDALWADKSEPLPSAATYLRSKYRLSEHQAKQAEQFLEQLTDTSAK